jgi:hypothetical protein
VCGVRDDEERRLLKQYNLVRLCVSARNKWCQDSGRVTKAIYSGQASMARREEGRDWYHA